MWGTKYWVNLPKPKLNSSDSQVSHAGIFWDLSTGQGHFCLVQECYVPNLFICPPNLTHSFHTVCKIIRFNVGKKKFFSMCSRGTAKFLGPNKPFFQVDME
jgi:hypothetical protein